MRASVFAMSATSASGKAAEARAASSAPKDEPESKRRRIDYSDNPAKEIIAFATHAGKYVISGPTEAIMKKAGCSNGAVASVNYAADTGAEFLAQAAAAGVDALGTPSGRVVAGVGFAYFFGLPVAAGLASRAVASVTPTPSSVAGYAAGALASTATTIVVQHLITRATGGLL